MKRRALLWGLGCMLLGTLVALGWLPGTASWQAGPRVGTVALLWTLGFTILGLAAAPWILRRTTRPEDYQGSCPVGWPCGACGAFNLRHRRMCRSCGIDAAQGLRLHREAKAQAEAEAH